MNKELQTEGLKKYKNGGRIEVYKTVDRTVNDFDKKFDSCNYFAKQGKKTVMTPKVHHKDPAYKEIYSSLIGTKYEGKCPDFKIEDDFYEHEGFDVSKNTNPTRTFSNMISRGISQSNRIVIDDNNIGRVWAQRNIYNRVKNGQDINEVWILENSGTLTRIF